MKNLFFALAFLFVGSVGFANNNSERHQINLCDFSFFEINKISEFDDCELSATGTVESAEFGTMIVTISVTGPCDSRLAYMLIDKIAEFRSNN